MGKPPFKLFKDIAKNINGPKYDYIDHLKWPVDFPVKNDGSIFSDTVIDDIRAMIYYVETLLFSTSQTNVNGRNVGGVLGKNYTIKLGKCKNGKDKKLFIRNKIGIMDWTLLGLPPQPFGDGPDGFNGLIPGILGQIISINPYQVFKVAQGKSDLIECFNSNKKYKIFYYFIILLIIFIFFYLNK